MPQTPTPENSGLDEEQLYVEQNIGKYFSRMKNGAEEDLYLDKGISKAANRFLKSTELYDTDGERWVDLGETMTRDDLRTSIIKILRAIQMNVGPKAHQKARQIVDTHSMFLRHSQAHDRQGNIVYSSPDVVVTGQVRDNCSFERPAGGNAGYSNAVICIEIRPSLETTGWKLEKVIAQLGMCARYGPCISPLQI